MEITDYGNYIGGFPLEKKEALSLLWMTSLSTISAVPEKCRSVQDENLLPGQKRMPLILHEKGSLEVYDISWREGMTFHRLSDSSCPLGEEDSV